MKKITTLFKIEYLEKGKKGNILNEINPENQWVLNGEGIATIKLDGTACLIKDNILYRRYDCKRGKIPPEGFIPCQEPDQFTGHWPGWLEVKDEPNNKWHIEAFNKTTNLENGTYELIGKHFNNNPYNMDFDTFFLHGELKVDLLDRGFDSIKTWLSKNEVEGIVFHNEDGRMCKIRRSDFGFKWPIN